ncbi:MAG: 16S rRNA (guanine(527)-N(7))-methyltransferase RsmG [Pseudomonadota bacterium]
MTEEEGQQWIVDRFGNQGHSRLAHLAALVRAEATHQNLVSASTLDSLWVRHIVDSAQLLQFADGIEGSWLDIGTGAGFPGMVVALLRDRPTILVEPRRRRADFLTVMAGTLGISHSVTVIAAKVETAKVSAAIISARAVAPVDVLLTSAAHVASIETRWLLPKGLRAREEVAQARQAWHGMFHVEHSVTDPNSLIVIASKVSRR